MKNLVNRVKKKFLENKKDLKFLLFAGLPTGILLAVLNRFVRFGELY